MDLVKIDKRIKELNDKSSSSLSKRKDTLKNSLNSFFHYLGKIAQYLIVDLANGFLFDLKHFLVWKDDFGKTPVHKINCTFLGTKELGSCECPR